MTEIINWYIGIAFLCAGWLLVVGALSILPHEIDTAWDFIAYCLLWPKHVIKAIIKNLKK